jgi:hypothetical protein
MHLICHGGVGSLMATATQRRVTTRTVRRAILESVARKSFTLIPVLDPLG